MTMAEFAKKMGLTLEQLRDHAISFLQNEGCDEAGNEYATLEDWINKKPVVDTYDGGKDAGMMGYEGN